MENCYFDFAWRAYFPRGDEWRGRADSKYIMSKADRDNIYTPQLLGSDSGTTWQQSDGVGGRGGGQVQQKQGGSVMWEQGKKDRAGHGRGGGKNRRAKENSMGGGGGAGKGRGRGMGEERSGERVGHGIGQGERAGKKREEGRGEDALIEIGIEN
jgi:hypothetical protein